MTLVDYKERKKNVLQKIANSHILRNHGNIQIMRVSNKENYRVRAYAVCRDETHTMMVKHLRSAPQLFSFGVSASSPQELINKASPIGALNCSSQKSQRQRLKTATRGMPLGRKCALFGSNSVSHIVWFSFLFFYIQSFQNLKIRFLYSLVSFRKLEDLGL